MTNFPSPGSPTGQPAIEEKPNKASEIAAGAVGAVSNQVKDLLNRQVGSGCDLVSKFAKSAAIAADDLNEDAPQLAGIVRGAATRLEGLAKDLHDQSVDELVSSASDFTRRQPALVFGLAAVAGFLAVRTVYSASSAMPPHQELQRAI